MVLACITQERVPAHWSGVGDSPIELTPEDYGFILEKAAQRGVIQLHEMYAGIGQLECLQDGEGEHLEHGLGRGIGVATSTVIYVAFKRT